MPQVTHIMIISHVLVKVTWLFRQLSLFFFLFLFVLNSGLEYWPAVDFLDSLLWFANKTTWQIQTVQQRSHANAAYTMHYAIKKLFILHIKHFARIFFKTTSSLQFTKENDKLLSNYFSIMDEAKYDITSSMTILMWPTGILFEEGSKLCPSQLCLLEKKSFYYVNWSAL